MHVERAPRYIAGQRRPSRVPAERFGVEQAIDRPVPTVASGDFPAHCPTNIDSNSRRIQYISGVLGVSSETVWRAGPTPLR